MCGTQNDQNAQSCSYCGYLFENFSTTGVETSAPPPSREEATISAVPPPLETASVPSAPIPPSASMISTGAPLFVVSRSLLGSLLPAIIYLIFITFIGLSSGIYFILLVVFFLLIAIVPVLFTPRKYEFYDSSLRIHKIVGGDSDIAYSDLTFYESQAGRRRPQIVLSAEGQKRAIVISGNPTNKELGMNLDQFLQSKLKKYTPKPKSEENPQEPATTTDAANAADNNTTQ